jgi:uncharacterized protein YjbI with pentapeptide repeats
VYWLLNVLKRCEEDQIPEQNRLPLDLRDANLQGADLQGAILQGAFLDRANLKGAKLTDEQLAVTRSLKGTTMPDGSKHS